MAHVIHILDETIIFLPESHPKNVYCYGDKALQCLPGVLFDCLCWWGELFCDWRPGPIFRDTNSQWVAQRQLEARPRVTERGEGGARPVITHPISCIYHFCLEIFVYIIMNEKLNLDKRIKMLLLWHKWIITWLWLFSGSFYLLHNVWHFDLN